MTRNALLPPLWGIVSEYLHDVELCMLAELAIMPAGKYHKDPKNITMPEELVSAYEERDTVGVVKPLPDKLKSMASELTFIYEAALYSCINVIEWKYLDDAHVRWDTCHPLSEGPVLVALKTGAVISDDIKMLEWAERYFTPSKESYPNEPGCWGSSAIRVAFQYRKNNTAKRVREKMITALHFDFGWMAVMYDNLELLQWHWDLLGKKIDSATAAKLLPNAVEGGSPPMLDWLLAACGSSSGKDKSHLRWYAQAAKGGKISNLEWLRENGFAGVDLVGNLADAKNLEVARWLRKHGCPWDRNGAAEIYCYATAGKVDLLEYAISEGCPWIARAYGAAAVYDRLDVLQWGVKMNFPISADSLIYYIEEYHEGGAKRVLAWLKAYQHDK